MLSELERDPNHGHQLRGPLTGLRSYRVEVYRIIYELHDDRRVRVVASGTAAAPEKPTLGQPGNPAATPVVGIYQHPHRADAHLTAELTSR